MRPAIEMTRQPAAASLLWWALRVGTSYSVVALAMGCVGGALCLSGCTTDQFKGCQAQRTCSTDQAANEAGTAGSPSSGAGVAGSMSTGGAVTGGGSGGGNAGQVGVAGSGAGEAGSAGADAGAGAAGDAGAGDAADRSSQFRVKVA